MTMMQLELAFGSLVWLPVLCSSPVNREKFCIMVDNRLQFSIFKLGLCSTYFCPKVDTDQNMISMVKGNIVEIRISTAQ